MSFMHAKPLALAFAFLAVGRPVWGQDTSTDPPQVSCSLSGRVLDANEEPVPGACVLVCDADSGVPCLAKTFVPLTEAMFAHEGQKTAVNAWATETTNDAGRFRFSSIPPGTYRLVAQTWNDVARPENPLDVNGVELTLRGVADRVTVSAGTNSHIAIRPLGTGTVRLDQGIGNDETLLVLSTGTPRADPILGFVGWGGPFLTQAIGVNRMPGGRSVIHGLPEGRIHMTAFAADNSPGWGAARAVIRPERTTIGYVPIVAGWSDGHHEPPPALLPLMDELRRQGDHPRLVTQSGVDLDRLRSEAKTPWHYQRRVAALLDDPVDLGGDSPARVGDVLAALGYLRLEELLDRRKAASLASRPPADAQQPIDYAEAFQTLYDELERNYPCFELKGIDWGRVGRELLPRAAEVASDDTFARLATELVAKLEDSHAYLQSGTSRLPRVDLPRFDPGFACLIDDRGRPAVYYVDSQGPADLAGVEIGMTVLSVDGRSASEAIEQIERNLSRFAGYSSDRYLRYAAARALARRKSRGVLVQLRMQSLDRQIHEFELPAVLPIRYLPRLPVPNPGISDAADVDWKMLDQTTGYIYVRRIRSGLIESLDRAVADLRNAEALIVDVRGNSGGGFDSERAHRNFAPDDPDEPDRPRFGGPIALLIDARCISAGEGWASWFLAHDRARVFGQTTAGASARKITSDVAGGRFRVTYPVKPYKGYLDRFIERRGLEPDVPLMQRASDLAAGRDTVLTAAQAYLAEVSSSRDVTPKSDHEGS